MEEENPLVAMEPLFMKGEVRSFAWNGGRITKRRTSRISYLRSLVPRADVIIDPEYPYMCSVVGGGRHPWPGSIL